MSDECCKTGEPMVMPEDAEAVVVMGGVLADLQRAGDRLGERGIHAEIVRGTDGEAAGGCCATKLYLMVAREDAAAARAVFDQEWRRGLSEDQIAALEASSEIVLDPDAAETTCPACLTTFATGPAECPDCGLVIG